MDEPLSPQELDVVETRDGSSTLFSPRFNQHYHSIHGAIQESQHVFIRSGLETFDLTQADPLVVFEMGFGTGLNALLTALTTRQRPIHYLSVEAFPLGEAQWRHLNYPLQLGDKADSRTWLTDLHQAQWDLAVPLAPLFTLEKHAVNLANFEPSQPVDLVYWDAFAPSSQPELWTEEVFGRVFAWMRPGGVWVSYSAKGAVRRALQAVGFEVERIPGPPGKREMLRAKK